MAKTTPRTTVERDAETSAEIPAVELSPTPAAPLDLPIEAVLMLLASWARAKRLKMPEGDVTVGAHTYSATLSVDQDRLLLTREPNTHHVSFAAEEVKRLERDRGAEHTEIKALEAVQGPDEGQRQRYAFLKEKVEREKGELAAARERLATLQGGTSTFTVPLDLSTVKVEVLV